MATPITPPSTGFHIKTTGWQKDPTVPITPPSTGFHIKVGGRQSQSHWSVGLSMSRDGWSLS